VVDYEYEGGISMYELYTTFDKPIPYKDLLFYPILLKDCFEFYTFVDCLTIEKNDIPDAKVISMTYLEYLYYASTPENSYLHLGMILRLLLMCLHMEMTDEDIKSGNIPIDFLYDTNKKPIIKIKVEVNGKMEEKFFDSNDFDEIRKIITLQNAIELPDETMSKQLRDTIKEQQEYRQKLSGFKQADLEEQIGCVYISTGATLEELYNMPIRKFLKIQRRIDEKLHYQIFKSASMSGFVTFKDKNFPLHWMRDLNKNVLDDLIVDVEEAKQKMNAGGKVGNVKKKNPN
jgi:hypothetical protein